MTNQSPLDRQRQLPNPTGLSLAVLTVLAAGALAIGLVAANSILAVSSIDAQAGEARRGELLAMRGETPPIPGFQRRGTSFVGDVRGSDGALLRLVFDARTQTLIGMKVIEPAGSLAEATARTDCRLRPDSVQR